MSCMPSSRKVYNKQQVGMVEVTFTRLQAERRCVDEEKRKELVQLMTSNTASATPAYRHDMG